MDEIGQIKSTQIPISGVNIGQKGIRKVGTREQVFKGLALRTSGNLVKSDIEFKIINGVEYYISKRISERMKELIRKSVHNRRNRKTQIVNGITKSSPDMQNTSVTSIQSTIQPSSVPITQIANLTIDNSINKRPNNKTMKNISFLTEKNSVKEVFYSELTDQDISALRAEAEADDTMRPPKEFKIETLDNVDLELDFD
jgi:hypothetical protein